MHEVASSIPSKYKCDFLNSYVLSKLIINIIVYNKVDSTYDFKLKENRMKMPGLYVPLTRLQVETAVYSGITECENKENWVNE